MSVTSSAAASDSTSSGNLASNASLDGSVDESRAYEDLGTDDDDGGGQELGIDDGHAADERDSDDDGLHFVKFLI